MWNNSDGTRTTTVDTVVEVVNHDGSTVGPVRADHVVWRDVKVWRAVAPAPLEPSWQLHPPGCVLPVDGATVVEVVLRGGHTGISEASRIDWLCVEKYRRVPGEPVLKTENATAIDDLKASVDAAVLDAFALKTQLNAALDRECDLKAQLATVAALTDERNALKELLGNHADWLARENDLAALTAQLKETTATLEATRVSSDSIISLGRVFQAQAEVREARALHNYAGVKLERAVLLEQIASAISRGHLQSDFYAQLREWTK